eukprot:symbB.v1.2.006660.t1/scaffold372.1/size218212/12
MRLQRSLSLRRHQRPCLRLHFRTCPWLWFPSVGSLLSLEWELVMALVAQVHLALWTPTRLALAMPSLSLPT